MTSRTLRRRLDRRLAALRVVPSRPVLVHVAFQDFATGITQSFLIKPGEMASVALTGYANTDHGPRVLVVPVKFRADLS